MYEDIKKLMPLRDEFHNFIRQFLDYGFTYMVVKKEYQYYNSKYFKRYYAGSLVDANIMIIVNRDGRFFSLGSHPSINGKPKYIQLRTIKSFVEYLGKERLHSYKKGLIEFIKSSLTESELLTLNIR